MMIKLNLKCDHIHSAHSHILYRKILQSYMGTNMDLTYNQKRDMISKNNDDDT